MIIKEFTPELMVNNVSESISFYKSLLEAKPIATEEEEGRLVWAKIALNTQIHLSFKSKEKLGSEYSFFKNIKTGGSFTLCFNVPDIHALYNSVQSKAEVINPLHETECKLFEFSIKDLDGYLLTFLEG